MKLRELLEGVACTGIRWPEEEDFDQEITGITSDSREVAAGGMFVCIRGFLADGHEYIDKAIEAGAGAVIVEEMPERHLDAVMIQVEDSREAMAKIAAAWFGHPADRMDNDRTDRDQGKDHHGPYDKEDPGRSREKDGNDRNHRRIYRGGEDPNQEYYAGPL